MLLKVNAEIEDFSEGSRLEINIRTAEHEGNSDVLKKRRTALQAAIHRAVEGCGYNVVYGKKRH